MENDEVLVVLEAAKKLAQRYRELTGKPLGITGEVAEYEAARLLGLQLTAARTCGYDALEIRHGVTWRLQIKGRCIHGRGNGRVGSIDITKEFDAVILVVMNQNFQAVEIHEAGRGEVIEALVSPGSKARNERGSLSISKFRAIGHARWRAPGSA